MENFTFYNPTRIVFGKGKTADIGKVTAPWGQRVMLLYGQGSVKKTGILDTVRQSLEKSDITVFECGGVQPNPVLSFAQQAIEAFRTDNLDAIVAVGGGSVIDTAKTIAAGVPYNGNVWDFFSGKAKVESAIPITVVLTLPAAASEMNSGGVITNEQTQQKFNIMGDPLYPKVSILDPANTFSAPLHHSLYGVVDAMVHLLEGYFNTTSHNTVLQDRYAEGIIRTIMESASVIKTEPDNYEARANIMWGATLAFNGLAPCGLGATGFPMHMIEHSLSAIYDVSHGAGLAMILPGWMRYRLHKSPERFARFAHTVFDIQPTADPVADAKQGIVALEKWLGTMDIPASLQQGDIPVAEIPQIAQNAVMLAQKWGLKEYTTDVITEVLQYSAGE